MSSIPAQGSESPVNIFFQELREDAARTGAQLLSGDVCPYRVVAFNDMGPFSLAPLSAPPSPLCAELTAGFDWQGE